MKQKFFYFLVGLMIYGGLAYLTMYIADPNQNPWFYTTFWGTSMALIDVFVFRKFKKKII